MDIDGQSPGRGPAQKAWLLRESAKRTDFVSLPTWCGGAGMPGKPAELRRCNCASGKGSVPETDGPVLGNSAALQGPALSSPVSSASAALGRGSAYCLLQATGTTPNVSLFKPPGPRYPRRAQLCGERERNSEQRHSKCETKADTASGRWAPRGSAQRASVQLPRARQGRLTLAVPGPA